MANEEHLELFKQGRHVWWQWQLEHRDIRIDLSKSNLREMDLSYAHLSHADLHSANLRNANLRGAHLEGANLSGAQLEGADLGGTTLYTTHFFHTNMNGTNLSEANFGDNNFFLATLRGANLSQAKLNQADLHGMNLENANLSGTALLETNLREANLRGADLSRAKLREATLREANLSEASLCEADLSGADLSQANLNGADLSKANLRGATFVDTDLTRATLTGCSIYGISVWNVQLGGAKQDNLIITSANDPPITVDDLEVAQFIYLLLNHKKLRNVLNAVTERGVLLLGRFGGGGLEVLQAVAARLREERYLPIIFDFERPRDRNYTEIVKTLAGLSRFIIADLSGPSVPQELYATVPHFKIPFVPILEAGRKQYAMFVDLLEYPWVVRPPVIFASTDELISLVPTKIIAPAEEKHQARQQLLDELFPS